MNDAFETIVGDASVDGRYTSEGRGDEYGLFT